MKLHFEPDLDYQRAAIDAVCELFRGQEICRTEFTVTRDGSDPQYRMGFAENDLGIGNRLTLLDDELLKNLDDIQIRNGIRPSESLSTVGAINKKEVNNLYKPSEKVNDEKPIDLIKATRPIVIVDEPQSVDGGLEGRGREALTAMNPLCTLRYSATHADKHHMVFRLDAVDAYDRKLVKQIEVASATVQNAHNRPYVKLISVANKRGIISAKVELDVAMSSGVQRREVTVQDGDNLEETTKRAIYADCRIGEIRVAKDNEYLELRVPGGEHYLRSGEAWGDVDPLAVQREMIRRTIREHLDKEKRLRPQGIKVLSLFFIDRVDRYRSYDAAGNQAKGDYARIFEEEYRRAAKLPDYQTLFAEVDLSFAAEDVHDGYFSIDKRGSWTVSGALPPSFNGRPGSA
jgi:type III restriction enzyme